MAVAVFQSGNQSLQQAQVDLRVIDHYDVLKHCLCLRRIDYAGYFSELCPSRFAVSRPPQSSVWVL